MMQYVTGELKWFGQAVDCRLLLCFEFSGEKMDVESDSSSCSMEVKRLRWPSFSCLVIGALPCLSLGSSWGCSCNPRATGKLAFIRA